MYSIFTQLKQIKLLVVFALLSFVGLNKVQAQVLIEEDFSTGALPTGWNNTDLSGSGGVWYFDNPNGWPIAGGSPGFDDNFAIFDSDFFGFSMYDIGIYDWIEDAALETPEFDASIAGSYILEFDNSFMSYWMGTPTVEVWDGTTWNVVLTMDPETDDGAEVANRKVLDITDFTGGSPNAKVRFHWVDGYYDYYWAIDNVKISRTEECTAPVGTFLAVPNCDESTFEMEITLEDLGDAESLIITDGTTSFTATEPGVFTFGPYAFSTVLEIIVEHPASEYCSLSTGLITFTSCPSENDECLDATELEVNVDNTCAFFITGNNEAATLSSDLGIEDCSWGDPSRDLWYKFTATSSVHAVEVNYLSGYDNLVFGVYQGECGSLTTLLCGDSWANLVTIHDLTIGDEYYVRVWTEFNDFDESTEFTICVKSPIQGSTCGNPIPATTLPYVHSSSTEIYGDYLLPTEPGSECGSDYSYLSGNDVVYEFIAPATTNVDIILSDISDNYNGIFIYENCGDIGVNCITGSVNGYDVADLEILDFPVEAGNSYFIVVSTWAAPMSIDYTLTISADDLPCSIPTLVVTNDTICGGQAATIGVESDVATSIYEWYDSESDGVLLATGNTYSVSDLTTTTSFWVKGIDGTCESERSEVIVVVNEIPTISGLTDTAICYLSDVILEIESSVEESTIEWFEDEDLTISLGMGTSLELADLTEDKTVYVRAMNAECVSEIHVINITVLPIPTISASGTSICTPGTLTLEASSSSDAIIRWYTDATGGSHIFEGGIFESTIAASTTYYVEALIGDCISERIAVVVDLNESIEISSTDVNICSPDEVTLIATSTNPDAIVNWYESSSSSEILFTGESYNVGLVDETITYYAEANTLECNSERIPVTITLNDTPIILAENVTICAPGLTTIIASSTSEGVSYEWYDSPTDGTLLGSTETLEIEITESTIFYVQGSNGACTSERIAVEVVLNPLEVTASSATTCAGASVILEAVIISGEGTIEWFDVETGGDVLGTGSTYVIPSISTSTLYYVQLNNGSCVSERIPVEVFVSSSISVFANDILTCGTSAVTLVASSDVTDAEYKWFASESDTEPIFEGNPYTTDILTSSATYYVEANIGECESPRIPVYVGIGEGELPSIYATGTRICIEGVSTLTASSTTAGASFEWFDASSGGTMLGEGSIFVTDVLTSTTNFYVQSRIGDCISERFMVPAIVTNPIINPTHDTVCYNSPATLVATSVPTGVIRWYADETSTTVTHTGTSYTTPSLTATTTYWVASTVLGCTTPERVPVVALVLPELTISTDDVTFCEVGSVTLEATASIADATIEWYDSPIDGTLLFTGSTFVTDIITEPTTYYVRATYEECISEFYTVNIGAGTPPSVSATAGASICVSGTTTLTASSSTTGAVFYWYDSETSTEPIFEGATFETPEISENTIFYVEANTFGCFSDRIPVEAIVMNPTVTVSEVNTICISGVTMATATSTLPGAIIRWYNSLTGSHIHSGSAFTPPVTLTETTTYYVAVTYMGCTSDRIPVVFPVNEIPELNIVSDTLCISGNGILSVSTESYDELEYNWYANATGGVSLGSGSSFTTPLLSTSTTYYVEPVKGDCIFPRVPVTVIVNDPTPSVSGTIICGPGVASMNAFGVAGATYNWYSSATSSTPIFTGDTYSTTITSTTNFYVSATLAGCESSRVMVTAEVRPVPVVSSANVSICGASDATLLASSTVAGSTFTWYSAPTGGTVLGTGSPFTYNATATTTIYVQADAAGCISTRIPVTITVNPVPVVTATANEICILGTSTLTASSTITGSTINWYTSATATSPVFVGATYTTPVISTTTTYYVEAVSANGCVSTRIPVVVNVINPTVSATDVIICDPAEVSLLAVSSTGSTVTWYATEVDGSPIHVGNLFTTPLLTETTTYFMTASIGTCVSERVPVTVTVNNYEFDIVEGNVCEGGFVNLHADILGTTATIEWYDSEDLTTLLHVGTDFTTPFLTATTTYYFVAVTPECTTNPRPVVATVNVAPLLSVDPVTALVCPGDSAIFTATIDSDYTYEWSTGATTAEMATNVYGNHTITVTDENGCQSSMIVFLDTIVSPTVAGFDYIPNIFSNPYMYQFSPVSATNATGYFWDFGDGNSSDEENPTHEFAAFGIYNVKLYVFNECDTAMVGLEIYVHPTNSIENIDDESLIGLFPNPATKDLNISISNTEKIAEIKVYDQIGKLLMHENIQPTQHHTISVDRLAQGAYYIIITTENNKSAVRRFVVQ